MDMLTRPPKGEIAAPSDRDLQEDEDSFMSFAAAFGVAPPAPSPVTDPPVT